MCGSKGNLKHATWHLICQAWEANAKHNEWVECNQSQQNQTHNTDVLFFKIVPLAIGFEYDIKILQYKLIGQLHSWRVKSPAGRVIIIANSLVKQMLTHIKLPQHHKSPSKVSVIFRGSSSPCQYDVGYITSWGSCCLAQGGSAQQSNFSALNPPPPHLEASKNARLPFINTRCQSLHFRLKFVLHQRAECFGPPLQRNGSLHLTYESDG